MTYKCIVSLHPLSLEIDANNYNSASSTAMTTFIKRVKSTPDSVLMNKLEVRCFKL